MLALLSPEGRLIMMEFCLWMRYRCSTYFDNAGAAIDFDDRVVGWERGSLSLVSLVSSGSFASSSQRRLTGPCFVRMRKTG